MQKFLRLVFASGLISLFAASAHAQTGYVINATGISASPSSVFPGQSSTFSVAIVNGGAVSGVNDIPIGVTATAVVQFINTSSGYTFSLTGTAVTGTLITGKGGSGTMTFSAAIPTQTTEAGNYRATVTLSNPSGGSIGTATASVSTTVLTMTGTPDLQLTALSYTAGTSFSGGDVMPMSITYTNLNRGTGSGNFNVPWVPSGSGNTSFFRIQIVLSSNPIYGDADDFRLTFYDRTSKLDAGSSVSFTWNQLIPGNFSGSYYVLAKIDSLDGTTETTESDLAQNGNNIWLDVNAPRISIQPTNFPTNYLASTTGSASGNGYSDNPSTSSDGRYTVFASDASNLVSGDTNGTRDIFLFDNQTNTTRRLNLSRQGEQTNGPSNRPVISADGRYVAFESTATNLILGDTNGFSDIFVVDVITGAIDMLSLDASGTRANNSNFRPSISSTGRYVSFESSATNLVSSGTSVGVSHIYVRDRDVSGSGTFDTTGNISTVLVSQSSGGTAANGNSLQSVLSADGRYIAFASDATNLVSSDTNAVRDIFLRDRTGGTTTRVSVATGGTQATGGDSRTPSLSSDGRYIAFASSATNLASGDTNGVSDIFVHDRTTTTTQRISVSTSGTEAFDPSATGFKLGSINPSISSTGRYVAFASLANNLTAGDSAGQKQNLDANDALDVFVRDRDVSASGTYDTSGNVATTMVSLNKFGLQTLSILNTQSTASSDIFPSISADGRWVAFPSDAENVSGLSHTVTNLISIDNNNTRDVFLFDRVTNALPNSSIAPSVTITSPGTATSILVNTATPITVSATTTVGVVSTVQFFVNGTSLGTTSVFPYTQTWTPTAVGNYVLSALVTDSFGNRGVSSNVTVTVKASPSVGVTSPVFGSSVTVGTTQTVTAVAAASNPGATITSVQFLANGISLGTSLASPYSVAWTPASAGTYNLTAIATDSIGTQATSSSVAITVTAAGGGGGGGGGGLTAPVVVIDTPANGSTLTVNTSQTISATASLTNGTVTSVAFSANGTSIGSATVYPYTINWTPTALGTFTITAVATGSNGAQATAVNTVTVSSATAPTVSITAPSTGSTVGVNLAQTITATAASSTGYIASVEFLVNGKPLSTDTVFPYTASWTPSGTGTYILTAVAKDNSGVITTSAPASITVAASAAPTVSLTNPGSGSSYTIGSSLTLTAAASDSDGTITQVSFYVNGALLSTDTTAPYTSSIWTPASSGNYTLTAQAADNSGNVTTSTAVTVTIGSNAAPTVSITSPASGLNYSLGNNVLIGAVASDTDGFIAIVQFFANGQLIGAKTAAPYTFSWKPASAGTFALTAVATDNIGSSTTSTAVSVTVTSAIAPSVSLTNPASGASYGVGTSIPLNAAVTGGNGPTAQVEFFINGASLSIDSSAPYNTVWTPASAGTYSLIAVATDNAGVSGTSTAINVTVTSNGAPAVRLISPGTNLVVGLGTTVNLSAAASDADGSIASVRFLSNGTALAVVASSPYRTTYTPSAAGIYTIVAQATDNSGNVADSVAQTLTVLGGNAPVVSLVNPSTDLNISADSSLLLSATAETDSSSVRRVEFYAGSTLLTTKSTQPYTYVWRPASIGTYAIRAVAYDANGTGVSSSVSNVSVTSAVANAGAFYAQITNPTTGTTVVVFRNINLSAVTNIGSVSAPAMDFYQNGYLFKTVTSAPYEDTFNITVPGNYEFYAVARVSSSVYTSAPVAVTVLANAPPAVTLTAPATGSTINVGNSVTIKANASDLDDQIDTVKFLVNGQALSTSSAYPYTATWKPTAEGIYTLTAIVKDSQGSDRGNQTTSNPIYIRVAALTSSSGTANYGADSIYAGTYAGGSENGKFTAINIGGRNAAYIGYSTTGTAKTYLYNGLTVDSSGSFSSGTAITGRFNDTGISGTLDSSRLSYIGPIAFANGTTFASGYYTGNLAGRSASTVAAIVGLDGSITAYLADGSYTDAGSSTLDSTGAFDFRLAGGSRITGKADSSTGFLSGTLSGGPGGTFTGALVSGSTFSDGTLRNLSTRGQVGTGSNILIAGFVVGGSSPKQILIRAIGPTLSGFGITGALADSQLELFKGTTRIALNDNWAGNTAITSASVTVGAFQLTANSLDAVVLAQLDPGAYTAQVSGVGGRTGVALVELYDVDSVAAFAPQKLINVATRGVVGTGENQLIAGFVVNGTTTKKVLIRGVGPTLTSLGVTGALADPVLQLIQTKGSARTVVRENDNWETGNDVALITAATTKAGAFPLTSGSKDAVLLLNLPPGTYNATVSGVGGTTGVGLVEVYEVP
jgi:Tol biopolymer transport system component